VCSALLAYPLFFASPKAIKHTIRSVSPKCDTNYDKSNISKFIPGICFLPKGKEGGEESEFEYSWILAFSILK
jgi:hypothetical protein